MIQKIVFLTLITPHFRDLTDKGSKNNLFLEKLN